MDRMQVLTLISVVITGLSHALKDGTFPKKWSVAPTWIALGLAALGIAQGTVDMVMKGSPFAQAFTAVMATTGPGFIVLLFEAIGGGGGDAGGSASKPTSLVTPKIAGMSMAALALTLAFVPGCGFFQKIGPAMDEGTVLVEDGARILDTIRSVVDVFFMADPNPKLETDVRKALADANLGLDVAVRMLQGVKDVTQGQLDEAFAQFRGAYAELYQLLVDAGIVTRTDGKLAVARRGVETVTLPVPLAMQRK